MQHVVHGALSKQGAGLCAHLYSLDGRSTPGMLSEALVRSDGVQDKKRKLVFQFGGPGV